MRLPLILRLLLGLLHRPGGRRRVAGNKLAILMNILSRFHLPSKLKKCERE